MNTVLFDRRALGAATVSVVALLVAFIASFAWLEHRVGELIDGELVDSLHSELRMYQSMQRETGIGTLVTALQRRFDYPGDPRMALLLDAGGQPIVGRLQDWPGDIATRTQLHHVEMGQGPHLHIVGGTMGPGYRLLIGQYDLRHEQFGRSLVVTGLVAMLLLLVAGVFVGLRFNRYVLLRLSGIAATAREIMRGQMQARAPEVPAPRVDAFGMLARTFNEMLDQNEALVTGMRTATESLAHDLRTPLMRLQRAIATARDTVDPAQREELLVAAEAEAEHALRTFGALIDLARAEAGLSRDAMERIDLAALATDVADLFEPLAEERQQRLERDLQPAVAVAHRQILFQALGNLIENAIKYSPAGAPLHLSLEPAAAGRGPAFVVSDAGPGIPAHAREQVLRPFVRLETAGLEPGAGLGLAIASAAARLHGGGLQLEDARPGLRVRLQLGPEGDVTAALPREALPELRRSRAAGSQEARSAAEA